MLRVMLGSEGEWEPGGGSKKQKKTKMVFLLFLRKQKKTTEFNRISTYRPKPKARLHLLQRPPGDELGVRTARH